MGEETKKRSAWPLVVGGVLFASAITTGVGYLIINPQINSARKNSVENARVVDSLSVVVAYNDSVSLARADSIDSSFEHFKGSDTSKPVFVVPEDLEPLYWGMGDLERQAVKDSIKIAGLEGSIENLDSTLVDLKNYLQDSTVSRAEYEGLARVVDSCRRVIQREHGGPVVNATRDMIYSDIGTKVNAMIDGHNKSLGMKDDSFTGHLFRTWRPLSLDEGNLEEFGLKSEVVDSLIYDVAFDSNKDSIADSTLNRIAYDVFKEMLGKNYRVYTGGNAVKNHNDVVDPIYLDSLRMANIGK